MKNVQVNAKKLVIIYSGSWHIKEISNNFQKISPCNFDAILRREVWSGQDNQVFFLKWTKKYQKSSIFGNARAKLKTPGLQVMPMQYLKSSVLRVNINQMYQKDMSSIS